LDASAEMVEAARWRLPEAAERLVVGDIVRLPFADATFDLVVATGVLEYADVERALAELARVLCPGGRAVVSYPNPAALYGIWKSHVWYPAVRGVKRLARRPSLAMPHLELQQRPLDDVVAERRARHRNRECERGQHPRRHKARRLDAGPVESSADLRHEREVPEIDPVRDKAEPRDGAVAKHTLGHA